MAPTDQRLVCVDDFELEPPQNGYDIAAVQQGARSCAAFPFRCHGQIAGVVKLYVAEPDFFDAEERALLDEMAADISFSLNSMAAQVAHRESELRYRRLFEASHDGILIIDADTGIIDDANPNLEELLGFTRDEFIGKALWEIGLLKDVAASREEFRKLQIGKHIRYEDLPLETKDGRQVAVEFISNVYRVKNRDVVQCNIRDITERKLAEAQVHQYAEKLQRSFLQIVALATSLSEMRDPYTAGHERRVAEIAVAIGNTIGLKKEQIEGIRVGGYLHDVGKNSIPTEILSKPGRISPVEFELIKAHAQAGYDALKDIDFPWPVAQIALQHHERMDGSGYPQGLQGDAILLEARIMAVADVIESMGSHRPYRAALGIDAAMDEINKNRGKLYDPAVADAALKLFREQGYQLPD